MIVVYVWRGWCVLCGNVRVGSLGKRREAVTEGGREKARGLELLKIESIISEQ